MCLTTAQLRKPFGLSDRAANACCDQQARGWLRFANILIIAAALGLSACASHPPSADLEASEAYDDANDPLEPINRGFYKFNQGLNAVTLRPTAKIYQRIIPPFIRNAIRDVLNNLQTPVILVNDLLQGEWTRAGTTATRFAINTTVGIGGTWDPASGWGYKRHSEDFGQTLATWGVGEGPYLFLPLLGPSNPRDGIGYAVDMLFDPLTYLYSIPDDTIPVARFAGNAVDTFSRSIDQLEAMQRTSLDFYATMRSLYRQRRKDQVNNGIIDIDALPEISSLEFEPLDDWQ